MKRELNSEGYLQAALDTIRVGKQALIFYSSRRSAEKGADDIAAALSKIEHETNEELSEKIEHALASPTKQCKRLAKSVREGVAFHHSGLSGTQRSLIENGFRDRTIKLICATPTLAAGVDLPSFRTIIKDTKRFSSYGMQYIPVLEYLQMAGRSGRPNYDDYGECVLVAQSESHKRELHERYILGEPEDITSKLATEPALRTHILALIANNVVRSKTELETFINTTFYAYQFSDRTRLTFIIEKIIYFLEQEGFIRSEQNDFVSAAQIGSDALDITLLGKRVSELYLDPLSASRIVRSFSEKREIVKYLFMLSSLMEVRPLPSVRKKDHDAIESLLAQTDHEIEEIEQAKLVLILMAWLEETTEDELLERYDITPGHLYGKLEIIDWLCYAASQIAAVLASQERSAFQKLRVLIKYGVSEELLPLVRLKDIGRKRARELYTHGIRDSNDIAKAPLSKLSSILGEKLAIKLKERSQVLDTQKTL